MEKIDKFYIFAASLLVIAALFIMVDNHLHQPAITPQQPSIGLSQEEQNLMGQWISPTGHTILIFEDYREGRMVTLDDCSIYTDDHDKSICQNDAIRYSEKFFPDGIRKQFPDVTYNEDFYWKAVDGHITATGISNPSLGFEWYYYYRTENGKNLLVIRGFSGAGKELAFHRE